MKLQEALRIMNEAGWTFICKQKEEAYGDWMEYTFRTPEGNRRDFTLGALRRRAKMEAWELWTKKVQAELAFGIQDELFDTADYAV